MKRLLISFVVGVCILAASVSCGKKDTLQYKNWPEEKAAAITEVQALVDGSFTIEYTATEDGAVFTVKGEVTGDLDLKVIKEGLKKLDPPLELKFDVYVNE